MIHADPNLYTGIIVGLATVAQQYLKRRSDRLQAEKIARGNEIVLEAVKTNNPINLFPADVLEKMLNVDSHVSPAEIARVIIAMKTSADNLEKYAHENVHRLSNILHAMTMRDTQ